MDMELKLEVLQDIHLTDEQRSAIQALCNRAYREYLTSLFNTFTGATHVLGYLGEPIVSHAMWVMRWLQPGDGLTLRTTYVEMVATDPNFQQHGFAAAVMRWLAEAISDFELDGLCLTSKSFEVRGGFLNSPSTSAALTIDKW